MPGLWLRRQWSLLPPRSQKKEELMELIKEVMPQYRQGDELLVELLALNLTKIQILEKEFGQRSYFDGGGVTTRMWDIYWNAMRQAIRICSELGLSPSSRNRLGLQVARQWSIAKELNLIEQEERENASGEAKALPQ